MKIGLLRYCAFPPLCRALLAVLMDLMSIAAAALLLRAEKTLATRIKPIFAAMDFPLRLATARYAHRSQFRFAGAQFR